MGNLVDRAFRPSTEVLRCSLIALSYVDIGQGSHPLLERIR